jgi:ABC-type microcin C transport system duplicated ATPase subunit YejF
MDSYPEARDEFWSIVDENNVDIVFSGHEHNYSRRIIDKSFSTEKYKFNNNIYQIISGGGGEKLKDKYRSKVGVIVPPIAKNHFIVMDILNKKLILKAYDIKGNIIDELEINK